LLPIFSAASSKAEIEDDLAAELAGHLRPPMKCGWRDDDLIAVDD
jgi:hypothetical protein